MRSTKIAIAASLALVIGYIVVPGSGTVNHDAVSNITIGVQVADGMPVPPLPPPKGDKLSLIADGMPVPPLPPPKGNRSGQPAYRHS